MPQYGSGFLFTAAMHAGHTPVLSAASKGILQAAHRIGYTRLRIFLVTADRLIIAHMIT
jgi:hypothetical protein